jgi:hypothetical protein
MRLRILASLVSCSLCSPAIAADPVFVRDPTFGTGGIATYEWPLWAAYQWNAARAWVLPLRDGRVAALTQLRSGNYEMGWLNWFEANGTVTPASPGGGPYTPISPHSSVAGLVQNWDNTIGVLGSVTRTVNDVDFSLIRMYPNGIAEGYQGCGGVPYTTVAFNVGPAGDRDDVPSAFTLDSTGRSLFAGHVEVGNGVQQLGVARLDRYCGTYTGFGTEGRVVAALGSAKVVRPKVIVEDPQERILIGGSMLTQTGTDAEGRCFITRQLKNGTFDGNFQGNGKYLIGNFARPSGKWTCEISDIVVDSQSRIYIAGSWHVKSSDGGSGNAFLLRLRPDGSMDSSFNGDPPFGHVSAQYSATSILLLEEHDVVIAFTTYAGSQDELARTNAVERRISTGDYDTRAIVGGSRWLPVPDSNAYQRVVRADADTFYVVATSGPNYINHHKTHVVRYRRASTIPTEPTDRIFAGNFDP